ncbi:MAG: aldose 1-epimerase family protein [Hungatella sp.]|nr:aldose 1-epimerase family protein [Hungatella sp.]
MLISLKNDSVSAVIETVGAELQSLKDRNKKEYIWQRDPRFWAKSSPVLFPAIGNSRCGRTIFDGQWYELSKHGFARDMEFAVETKSENKVSLVLKAAEETRAVFPYDFCLVMEYQLTDEGILINYRVENHGEKTMYYCLGAHPAFNCPMEDGEHFEDYCLEFEHKENCCAMVYDLKRLEFDAESKGYHMADTAVLPLKYELFDSDAIYFENLKSQKVSLVHGRTKRGVEVAFGDFATIAFWTPTGQEAPFLCIEPWNGSAIRSDEDDEFMHKHYVQKLDAGERKEYGLEVRILEGKA